MKQYGFKVVGIKRGNVDHIHATASSEAVARAAIVDYYGDAYVIANDCFEVNLPHQVFGEIDCTAPA
jgi:hypothetical protein